MQRSWYVVGAFVGGILFRLGWEIGGRIWKLLG